MSLALFDLDKTLIDGDSEELWIEYLIAEGDLPESAWQEVQRFGDEYVAGTMDFLEWQRFMLRPQASMAAERLRTLRADFTEKSLLPIIRPWMQRRISWHRDQGHLPVVITATNRWIVEPVVAALGIEELLATEPVVMNGGFNGEVRGEPCFQSGKIRHLEAWIAKQSAATGPHWAYSDSYNDLPLLEFADHPVAVTPDQRLSELAERRGWEKLNS